MIVELTRIRENVDLYEGRPAQNKSELIQVLAKETPLLSFENQSPMHVSECKAFGFRI